MADIESERDRCRKLEAVIAHNRGCEVKWQEYRALAMWCKNRMEGMLWREEFDERLASIDGSWNTVAGSRPESKRADMTEFEKVVLKAAGMASRGYYSFGTGR